MPHSRRPSIDPDPETMRALGYEAVDRIVDHLRTLGGQRVARRGTGADFAALVEEPLPTAGLGAADSMRFLFERVVPGMTRVNHPRFHAYIPAPSSFTAALGEILAAGLNPFVGTWLGGATVSALELVVLRWIAELVGYPSGGAGLLTSGGSIANLAALAAARAHALGSADSGGPGRAPSFDWARAALFVSAEGHGSMTKAAAVLGFPRDAVTTIPVDGARRMDVSALAAAVAESERDGRQPLAVCANAGTTNTGAVDPLEAIADFCGARRLWFHVDGAYGGFAAMTASGRRLLAGLERADSLTLDPHKWLYCPMGVGCVLVKERAALEGAFRAHGDYLKDLPADEVNFLDRGPELSRPARVFSVWMLLRAVGRDAVAAAIEEDLRLAKVAAVLLAEDARFEVLGDPELSVVAFRLRARAGESEAARAARDSALMEATLESGELMLSTTKVGGRSALRLVVMNHRTTEDDVRRTVRVIRETAA